MTFWQTATGAVLSTTVTVAPQVELLPFTSVTVSVTGTGPTSAQVKVVRLSDRLAIPQASLLPLFTAAAVVLPLPVASRVTVTFWQTATGAVLSTTVTVALAEETRPQASVTVSVTVRGPTSPQWKVDGETMSVTAPQASALPLSTAEAGMETCPEASRTATALLVEATGGVVSTTSIRCTALAGFPRPSVAVHVRRMVRVLPQPGVIPSAWDTTAGPHSSLAVATPVAAGAVEPPHSTTALGGICREGGIVSVTVTVKLQDAELPAPSVAVCVTVVEPIGKAEPLAGPAMRVMVGGRPELSVAVGAE